MSFGRGRGHKSKLRLNRRQSIELETEGKSARSEPDRDRFDESAKVGTMNAPQPMPSTKVPSSRCAAFPTIHLDLCTLWRNADRTPSFRMLRSALPWKVKCSIEYERSFALVRRFSYPGRNCLPRRQEITKQHSTSLHWEQVNGV